MGGYISNVVTRIFRFGPLARTSYAPPALDTTNSPSERISIPRARFTERMDALFIATIQATEEAITNAMIAAETMTGADYWRSNAIPHDQLQNVLRMHDRLGQH